MKANLCIHGHFYQPPREDPWLDDYLPEGSAAPKTHWNERICLESYAPLAWARRLDGEGRITDIVNVYEWISFNFGPTLLRWMERERPDVYSRILAGDAASLERLGHGNAMAQVFHHAILPLATPLDRRVEVAWGRADFKARFGRDPEGMWLAEAAVDTASLEALAEAGIRFTVFAPRQAAAYRPLEGGDWIEPGENGFPLHDPFQVNLPSGRSIAVFLYHGPLSQAVAFERLLEDGEQFFRRVSGESRPGLLTLCTDGETYGHHFTFGEMGLAYLLERARENGPEPTNFAAHLAEHPPRLELRLHEPSSWSCVHGVERWRSDCGCTDGGHSGWNQAWRGPLRDALNAVKRVVDRHFFDAGSMLFADSERALLDYGEVLARGVSADDYMQRHFRPGLGKAETGRAWKLLSMEKQALASFASCAWFFDEISRIEGLNAMTNALRACDLLRETGGPDPEQAMLRELGKARSNFARKGSGADVFRAEVRPRRETPSSLIAQALLSLWAEDSLPGEGGQAEWNRPGVRVAVRHVPTPGESTYHGEAEIIWYPALSGSRHVFVWERPALSGPLAGRVMIVSGEGGKDADAGAWFSPQSLPWNKRQAVALKHLRRVTDRRWDEGVQAMTMGVSLFSERQEAQERQTAESGWRDFWGPMVYAYLVCGAVPGLDAFQWFEDFLKRHAVNHPGRAEAERRLVQSLRERLEAVDPDTAESSMFQEVIRVLDASERVGLSPDIWVLQNIVWDRFMPSATVAPLAKRLHIL